MVLIFEFLADEEFVQNYENCQLEFVLFTVCSGIPTTSLASLFFTIVEVDVILQP